MIDLVECSQVSSRPIDGQEALWRKRYGSFLRIQQEVEIDSLR
ncbi:MAG: hypothetical protein FD168_3 [Desulfobulbaceae bacterium]|nr:MAG: hypothetical protein FD168_3 [Desulfobulbaceae bacterium]